ncbi:hypothetical protein EMMF5_004689 [Cystobasidiomycetes sp. EMM_F5]
MGLSGHCLCGATKIEIDIALEDATLGFDHCDACQRQTGSAYSLVLVCPKDKVKITGKDKDYAKPGDSGKPVHRVFCGEYAETIFISPSTLLTSSLTSCGSPIIHSPEAAPDIVAVKAGILDKETKQKLQASKAVDIYLKDVLPVVTQRAPKGFEGMPPH